MTETMFLAVPLPPEVVREIDALPSRAQRGVSWTRRAQWHLTIKYLGETDRDEALAALEVLQAPASDVVLGPEVTLLGSRIVMIPAAGLDATAAAVAEGFADVGEEQPPREFVGHLTLARLKGAPLKNPSTVPILGAAIDTTFRAGTIHLIRTELSPEGATHTLVAEQDLV